MPSAFQGSFKSMGRKENEMRKTKKNPIQVIKTDKAGPPVGPYSQAIKAGGFVFVAGEKGMDPVTQQIVPGGIEPETKRTLENIKAILEEAGSGMDWVVSTFVFMTDLSQFSKMNEIYAEYFKRNPPGRTTVEVKSLPAGAHVEITVTALVGPES
jgi:2-iminobutanoate/2-iminopropanoate deaminase